MKERRLIWAGLALSACTHAAFFCAGEMLGSHGTRAAIGIDLRHSFRAGSRRGARSPARLPGSTARLKPPERQAAAPAIEEETGPAREAGAQDESLINGADGGDLGPPSIAPRLMNLRELSGILRRCYPREERLARREGTVVLELSLGADGCVLAIAVVQSAGPSFDAAAMRVARFLRYAPAMLGARPVAVNIRQAIAFKMEA